MTRRTIRAGVEWPGKLRSMTAPTGLSRAGFGRGRIVQLWEALRASFGFLAGLAMLIAIILGTLLPALDQALDVNLPVLSFEGQASVRSLLETIGTTTVAVAGLSFSVTVVALTLASSQLSPRVLRNFRSDRLSQVTLALLLGTFVYVLILLVRLGVSGEDGEPPNLSITLAVILALTSFATFAVFIAHILRMLEPSSVIGSIGADGKNILVERFPSGPGKPDDPDRAARLADRVMDRGTMRTVEAEGGGYLTLVDVEPLIEAATRCDALVRQMITVGTYVMPGQVIARVWSGADGETLDAGIRAAFSLENQRTLVHDVAFPVRQLADIALRGLSPGINDPTTAENAMEALSRFLVEFARADAPSPIRVGEDGQPRFFARAPDLDDLVRLGFEQVREAAEPHPTVSRRLLELLEEVERSAHREAVATSEIPRQRQLIRSGLDDPSA